MKRILFIFLLAALIAVSVYAPLGQSQETGQPISVDVLVMDTNNVPLRGIVVQELIREVPGFGSSDTNTTNATGHVWFFDVTHGEDMVTVYFKAEATSQYYEATTQDVVLVVEQTQSQIFRTSIQMPIVHENQQNTKSLCSIAILFPAAIICLLLIVRQKKIIL